MKCFGSTTIDVTLCEGHHEAPYTIRLQLGQVELVAHDG